MIGHIGWGEDSLCVKWIFMLTVAWVSLINMNSDNTHNLPDEC
jgi:hypothetical protein